MELDELFQPINSAKEKIDAFKLRALEPKPAKPNRYAKHIDFYAEPKEPKQARADHNERTKKFYNDLGYSYFRVDHFDARLNIHHDLLGIADALALKPPFPPLLIQLTSDSNLSTRIRKILEAKATAKWIGCGAEIEVIGWKKTVSAGGKISYTPATRRVTL